MVSIDSGTEMDGLLIWFDLEDLLVTGIRYLSGRSRKEREILSKYIFSEVFQIYKPFPESKTVDVDADRSAT